MQNDLSTRWYRSADGRTLFVDTINDEGLTVSAEIRWEDDPTDEVIELTIGAVRNQECTPQPRSTPRRRRPRHPHR